MDPIGIAIGVLGAVVTAMGGPSAIIGKLSGALFGDSGAAVAGKVVDQATKAFGTTDPEQIKLKIAQDRSRADVFIAEVDADTKAYQIEVEDRKDARARDMEIRRIADERGVAAGTNTRANIMLLMAFITLIFIIGMTILYRASIPDGILAILQGATGALLTMITLAFNFEFGSSRGSSEKSNQIADMANTASAIATTAANAAAKK